MSRDVVYTCLFGHYEVPNEQPVAHSSNVDFICFTDRADLQSSTWQIQRVATLGVGAARESRRPKLMPHHYLTSYDRSCYIDASVVLKTAPEVLFSMLDNQKTDFLCIRHSWRTCAFDEAEEIIRLGIDDEARVREQMDHYRTAGLARNAGLALAFFCCAGTMCQRWRASARRGLRTCYAFRNATNFRSHSSLPIIASGMWRSMLV
jgi:hypothetical protein